MENRSESFNYKYIYDNYYKKCYLFAKSYVRNDMVAKDIASESLIKLWEVSQAQEISNYVKLLFEITKNKSLDYLKHEQVKNTAFEKMATLADRELQLRISTLECTNSETIFASDIQTIIKKTLSQLPEQTSQIFYQYKFEGRDKSELAENHNLSIKSIDYHLSKAICKLRDALKDYVSILFFIIVNLF